MKRVVLRAKSGPTIGMGHAMRARAVAQALGALHERALIVLDDAASAEALPHGPFDVVTAEEVSAWPAEAACAWLDGPADWSGELQALRERRATSILVEQRRGRELASYVLYPSLHYEPDGWDRLHPTRVLAGPRWVPLAGEIVATPTREPRRFEVLVTFGGSDPQGLTERVLCALNKTRRPPARLAVSIGAHMQARRSAIERLAAAFPAGCVLPTGALLAETIAASRAAVTALGTSLYEMAYLGVRALILANFPGDRAACEHYALNGPHRPLGLAQELDEQALVSGLERGLERLEAKGPHARVPGLGQGSFELAKLLCLRRAA